MLTNSSCSLSTALTFDRPYAYLMLGAAEEIPAYHALSRVIR